jgi:hypothetical protein
MVIGRRSALLYPGTRRGLPTLARTDLSRSSIRDTLLGGGNVAYFVGSDAK